MATETETKDSRFAAGFAYRAVTKVGGFTYFSERLTHVHAEHLLGNQPAGLVRIERAKPKNGMLHGEVNELEWETV